MENPAAIQFSPSARIRRKTRVVVAQTPLNDRRFRSFQSSHETRRTSESKPRDKAPGTCFLATSHQSTSVSDCDGAVCCRPTALRMRYHISRVKTHAARRWSHVSSSWPHKRQSACCCSPCLHLRSAVHSLFRSASQKKNFTLGGQHTHQTSRAPASPVVPWKKAR